MLRLGGNVFDAVVAAVLTSVVAEPCLTSIAGGGFLLAHTQAGENILFDFFAQTPRQHRDLQTVDFYPVLVNFGTVTQEFHIGLGSMAVPGTLAGLFHVHQRLGRLPLKIVAEPAIHHARAGIQLDRFQAYCFKILSPIWETAPEMRSPLFPNGKLLQEGDRLILPHLADTLSYLAEAGASPLYEGEIGQKLVQDCQERGGYLTREDLKQYRVMERSPLSLCYRGQTFLTNPPPSSGGALIAFALSLLEQVELSKLSFGSPEHLQLLALAMRLTNEARADGYDRNLYQPDVAERFLSPEHQASYAAKLRELSTLTAQTPINKWGSTTHVSAVDAEGNAASVTTTNGEGSGYLIPGTGIMVNNMLGEADLHPNGFHQWQENVRISSMMAPTMVLNRDRPEIVLGSGGSNRIRTAILQVISNIVDFGMDVTTAVNAPRIHWEGGTFSAEPGFPNLSPDPTQFPFDSEVVLWEEQNMFFGGVHTVMVDEEGAIAAVGDSRRCGAIATV